MNLTPLERLNARILIVDDQPANVALLEAMLADAGYTRVSSTTEPDKVCAMHRRAPFDLILLDLQMPGMDGFQVMEGLKASTADDDYLPVLVITAQPGHKLRALQAGAKDFVSKPFDLVEVKARIHNLIEVRLLHRQLARHNQHLEQRVLERTAELRESEARYRALTELATDWYWEQDGEGRFTKVSGPVLEMLGLQVDTLNGDGGAASPGGDGWNLTQRKTLQDRIAARAPFLDMVLSRTLPDGTTRQYRVSGTPMFDAGCTLVGYRGFGVEIVGSPK
ncbi:response regulator [Hydrogenophaga sp. SL48]|uniref:response regulator n=1 Tax=Hydrogenophaga sp. SL48 TaxID=2806347 RepID=UPI001F00A900|nr:response regulator [Hydrogenophaga sp. SL48]UJW78896.1 response regulator [Hydrogenophaga sp. SL48]